VRGRIRPVLLYVLGPAVLGWAVAAAGDLQTARASGPWQCNTYCTGDHCMYTPHHNSRCVPYWFWCQTDSCPDAY
jgi:hypothetical protein